MVLAMLMTFTTSSSMTLATTPGQRRTRQLQKLSVRCGQTLPGLETRHPQGPLWSFLGSRSTQKTTGFYFAVRYLNIGSVIGMDLEDWYGQRMDF